MIKYKNLKPGIDENTAKNYSLFDWQCYFRTIYFNKNTQIKKDGFQDNQVSFIRGYLVSHISQDLGDLAEAITDSNPTNLRKKIGSIFAWIFALANELDANIEDMIYEKFPGYCPYCCRTINCECAYWTPKQQRKDKARECNEPTDGKAHERPTRIQGWIEIWDIIFGAKYKKALSIAFVLSKLLEESAEILAETDKVEGRTVDKNKEYYKKMMDELADFTSWLFALIIKLEGKELENKTVPLILHEKFKDGCPWCPDKKICNCKTPYWIYEKS